MFYKKSYCSCKCYVQCLPRAIQVKEKFGSLCFYLTWGCGRMYDIIEEYEDLSEKVCETCGQPGRIVQINGWFYNRCKKCL